MKDVTITKKLFSKKYGLKEVRGKKLVDNTYDIIEEIGWGKNAHFFLRNYENDKANSYDMKYSVYSASKRDFIAIDKVCEFIYETKHQRVWDGYEMIETPETYRVLGGAIFKGDDNKTYFINQYGIHKESFKRVMGSQSLLYGIDSNNNVHVLVNNGLNSSPDFTSKQINPYEIFFIRDKSELKNFNLKDFIKKTDEYFQNLAQDNERAEVDKEKADFYEKFSKLDYLERFENEIISHINHNKKVLKQIAVEKEELEKVDFSKINLNNTNKIREISSEMKNQLRRINTRLESTENEVQKYSNLHKELRKMKMLNNSLAPRSEKVDEKVDEKVL